MADAVDDDVCAGVEAAWKASAALSGMFPLPPVRGRLTGTQAAAMPYVSLACEFTRSESAGTGGAWHDHRKVTLTVYGVEKDVKAAVAAVGDVFNLNTVLLFPSGARFMRWWPDGGNKTEIDPERKAGEDVWRGITAADVWSVRVYGGKTPAVVPAAAAQTALPQQVV